MKILFSLNKKIRVAPDTDLDGNPATGYPANNFAGYPAKNKLNSILKKLKMFF